MPGHTPTGVRLALARPRSRERFRDTPRPAFKFIISLAQHVPFSASLHRNKIFRCLMIFVDTTTFVKASAS